MSDSRQRSTEWIAGWESRVARGSHERLPTLDREAARYLDRLSDREAAPVLVALDQIMHEPSYGHPLRYESKVGKFTGAIYDLNSDQRIVYRYDADFVRILLIEAVPFV